MARHNRCIRSNIWGAFLASIVVSNSGLAAGTPEYEFEKEFFVKKLHDKVCAGKASLDDLSKFRAELAKFSEMPFHEDTELTEVADALYYMAVASGDAAAAKAAIAGTSKTAKEKARITALVDTIVANPKRFRGFHPALEDWATAKGYRSFFDYQGPKAGADSYEILARIIDPSGSAVECQNVLKLPKVLAVRKSQEDLIKSKVKDADAATLNISSTRTVRKNKENGLEETVRTEKFNIEGTLGIRLNDPDNEIHKSFLFARYKLDDTEEEVLDDQAAEDADDAEDDDSSSAQDSLTAGVLFSWSRSYSLANLIHNGEASITFDFPNDSKALRARYTALPDFGKSGVWIGDGFHRLGSSNKVLWALDVAGVVEANYVLDAGKNKDLIAIVARRTAGEVVTETQEADDYYGVGGYAKMRLRLWGIEGSVRYRYLKVFSDIVPPQHQFHAELSYTFPAMSGLGISASFTDGDDPESLIDTKEYKLGFTLKF